MEGGVFVRVEGRMIDGVQDGVFVRVGGMFVVGVEGLGCVKGGMVDIMSLQQYGSLASRESGGEGKGGEGGHGEAAGREGDGVPGGNATRHASDWTAAAALGCCCSFAHGVRLANAHRGVGPSTR